MKQEEEVKLLKDKEDLKTNERIENKHVDFIESNAEDHMYHMAKDTEIYSLVKIFIMVTCRKLDLKF